MGYIAQAVTVSGYGDREIIVMCRHIGGMDLTTRFGISTKVGRVDDVANLDGYLSAHAFKRTGAWEPTPYGFVADIKRTAATYDLGTEDRAAVLAVLLEGQGFRVTPVGTRLTLIESHLDYLRGLRFGVQGYADARDAIWLGNGVAGRPEEYLPVDYLPREQDESAAAETEPQDVVYRGISNDNAAGGRLIVVEALDGQLIGPLTHHVKHSRTGMTWGYGGSGPADLARSLLIDALGDEAKCPVCKGTRRVILLVDREADDVEPVAYDPENPEHVAIAEASEGPLRCWDCDDGHAPLPYQDFKFAFVAGWPPTGWSVTRSQIREWHANLRAR